MNKFIVRQDAERLFIYMLRVFVKQGCIRPVFFLKTANKGMEKS
jgi:hypothetical protein